MYFAQTVLSAGVKMIVYYSLLNIYRYIVIYTERFFKVSQKIYDLKYQVSFVAMFSGVELLEIEC